MLLKLCIQTVLLLAILVLTSASSQPQVPTTFGLITVTHTRAGDNSQFMKYLNRYAFMHCPIINQISIIWNNEKSMEQMGIFERRSEWKIPIYFYRTQYNSMYWRYNIPKQTKSQVFFSIDDDIIVDCEELMKGFEVWRKNAIGNLGPMITYGARFYEFTIDRNFEYGKKKQREYFNTGLNLAFVSRHFLQLYYADIWELNQLKIHILKKNNCDDIALNWIIQYFYPELPTIVIEGNIQNRSPAVAQSTSPSHYKYRNECLKDFTDIFGFNPLRYIRIKDKYPNRQKILQPLVRQIVLAKQRYLNKYILKKQSASDQPLINNVISESKVPEDKLTLDEDSPKDADLAPDTRKIYETQIQQLVIKQKELMHQMQSIKKNSPPEQIQFLKRKLQEEQKINKQLNQNNNLRLYFELGFAAFFLFILWKYWLLARGERQTKKGVRVLSHEFQYEVQKLGS